MMQKNNSTSRRGSSSVFSRLGTSSSLNASYLNKSGQSHQRAVSDVRLVDALGRDVTPRPLISKVHEEGQQKGISVGVGGHRGSMTGMADSASNTNFPEFAELDSYNLISENEKYDRSDGYDAFETRGQLQVEPPVFTERQLNGMATITIEETDTIINFSMPALRVFNSNPEKKGVLALNDRYSAICLELKRGGSDQYPSKTTQTIRPSVRNAETHTSQKSTSSAGTQANSWEIFDSVRRREIEHINETLLEEEEVDDAELGLSGLEGVDPEIRDATRASALKVYRKRRIEQNRRFDALRSDVSAIVPQFLFSAGTLADSEGSIKLIPQVSANSQSSTALPSDRAAQAKAVDKSMSHTNVNASTAGRIKKLDASRRDSMESAGTDLGSSSAYASLVNKSSYGISSENLSNNAVGVHPSSSSTAVSSSTDVAFNPLQDDLEPPREPLHIEDFTDSDPLLKKASLDIFKSRVFLDTLAITERALQQVTVLHSSQRYLNGPERDLTELLLAAGTAGGFGGARALQDTINSTALTLLSVAASKEEDATASAGALSGGASAGAGALTIRPVFSAGTSVGSLQEDFPVSTPSVLSPTALSPSVLSLDTSGIPSRPSSVNPFGVGAHLSRDASANATSAATSTLTATVVTPSDALTTSNVPAEIATHAQALLRPKHMALERLRKLSHGSLLGLSVSKICPHPTLPLLFAAGYAPADPYAPSTKGCAAVWSVASPQHPLALLELPEAGDRAGVTALEFCPWQPHLLAVGFVDGSVAVFNCARALSGLTEGTVLTSSSSSGSRLLPLSVTASNLSLSPPAGHSQPVSDLKWTKLADHSQIDAILSVSPDGNVLLWQLREALVPVTLLTLTNTANMAAIPSTVAGAAGTVGEDAASRVPLAALRARGEFTGTEGLLVRTLGGSSIDVPSGLLGNYMVGTDSGLIVRCAAAYNEHPLGTTAAHSAAVTKLKVSSFSSAAWLSASEDGSVKFWNFPISSSFAAPANTRTADAPPPELAESKSEERARLNESAKDWDAPPSCITYTSDHVSDAIVDLDWCPAVSTLFAAVSRDGHVMVFDLSNTVPLLDVHVPLEHGLWRLQLDLETQALEAEVQRQLAVQIALRRPLALDDEPDPAEDASIAAAIRKQVLQAQAEAIAFAQDTVFVPPEVQPSPGDESEDEDAPSSQNGPRPVSSGVSENMNSNAYSVASGGFEDEELSDALKRNREREARDPSILISGAPLPKDGQRVRAHKTLTCVSFASLNAHILLVGDSNGIIDVFRINGLVNPSLLLHSGAGGNTVAAPVGSEEYEEQLSELYKILKTIN